MTTNNKKAEEHLRKQLSKSRNMGFFEQSLNNVQSKKIKSNDALKQQLKNLEKSNDRLRDDLIRYAKEKGLMHVFKENG